jgi:arylsulfatase
MADLRADPFERGSVRNASMYWQDWQFRRSFLLVPAQGIVGGLIKSFEEYPPRNKPASFSVGNALKMLETAPHGK